LLRIFLFLSPEKRYLNELIHVLRHNAALLGHDKKWGHRCSEILITGNVMPPFDLNSPRFGPA
jgi:hypothetical protein